MKVHRFEKLWIALGLLLIVGFISTIAYGAVGPGIKMVDDSGGTINPDNVGDHPKFGNPGVYEADGENSYAVYVVARQFFFNPGTSEPIEVPANSEITFYVTSPDVTHGFSIAGTNANTMVIPGQIAEITVEFDGPQTYGIVCHEYCGSAHHRMEGTVKVVPQSQFNETEVKS